VPDEMEEYKVLFEAEDDATNKVTCVLNTDCSDVERQSLELKTDVMAQLQSINQWRVKDVKVHDGFSINQW
jgi:hypothetical protein